MCTSQQGWATIFQAPKLLGEHLRLTTLAAIHTPFQFLPSKHGGNAIIAVDFAKPTWITGEKASIASRLFLGPTPWSNRSACATSALRVIQKLSTKKNIHQRKVAVSPEWVHFFDTYKKKADFFFWTQKSFTQQMFWPQRPELDKSIPTPCY